MSATYTVDEFGDLFGLTPEERSGVSAALALLRAARKSPLQHPEDLLTPEQRESLQSHLEQIRSARNVPLTSQEKA